MSSRLTQRPAPAPPPPPPAVPITVTSNSSSTGVTGAPSAGAAGNSRNAQQQHAFRNNRRSNSNSAAGNAGGGTGNTATGTSSVGAAGGGGSAGSTNLAGPSTSTAPKKFNNKHDRGLRKRSKSFSTCVPKIKSMNTKPVLPSKFLLGGNINDPLNLNSLQDEEINRAMNAVTPKSSPIPTPPRRRGQIEVIIPQNIHDPLNLTDCADEADYEQQLCSPVKKGRKKRIRKRRSNSGTVYTSDTEAAAAPTEASTPQTVKDSAKIPDEVVPESIPLEIISLPSTSSTTDVPNTKTPASASSAEEKTDPKEDLLVAPSVDLPLDLSSPKKKRKAEDFKDSVKKIKYAMDKIVSPVIRQPGDWLKRKWSHHHGPKPPRQYHQNKNANLVMPNFSEKNKKYQYGNYNRYYGYRNSQYDCDPRLKCFAYYRELFERKDILDIGCNIGHITLSVARDFGARSVVGLDIDKSLIGIARKNIKHYVVSSAPSPPRQSPAEVRGGTGVSRGSQRSTASNDAGATGAAVCPTVTAATNTTASGGGGSGDRRAEAIAPKKKISEFFPISMPILYGPIDVPGFEEKSRGAGFPHNVRFVQGNYVLHDDVLIASEQPQFDVILCLSITKWIHLNWGDTGIKQAFKRMYAQLRPGGKLILEPQNWSSYKTKKKLTEAIFKNYNSIELFPEKFTQYLLSSEVGFAKSEILSIPVVHASKGFQRPIQVYTKSELFPSERIACPSSTYIGNYSAGGSTCIYVPPLTTPDLIGMDSTYKPSSDDQCTPHHVYAPSGRGSDHKYRPLSFSDQYETASQMSPPSNLCYAPLVSDPVTPSRVDMIASPPSESASQPPFEDTMQNVSSPNNGCSNKFRDVT